MVLTYICCYRCAYLTAGSMNIDHSFRWVRRMVNYRSNGLGQTHDRYANTNAICCLFIHPFFSPSSCPQNGRVYMVIGELLKCEWHTFKHIESFISIQPQLMVKQLHIQFKPKRHNQHLSIWPIENKWKSWQLIKQGYNGKRVKYIHDRPCHTHHHH